MLSICDYGCGEFFFSLLLLRVSKAKDFLLSPVTNRDVRLIRNCVTHVSTYKVRVVSAKIENVGFEHIFTRFRAFHGLVIENGLNVISFFLNWNFFSLFYQRVVQRVYKAVILLSLCLCVFRYFCYFTTHTFFTIKRS
jgi:hypothetical protein